jgi:hypothetical protein
MQIEDRGMPSSAVRTFSDPDEYAASVRGGEVELTVVGGGNFDAKLTRIELHRVLMQRFADNLPRIVQVASKKERAYFTFCTQPGPGLLVSSLEVAPASLLRHNRSHDYYQRSFGPVSFATMSLPVEDLAEIGGALADVDLTPPSEAMLVTPPLATMTKLQRLHAAAGDLAENAPEIIANPEAARGLEQALIETLAGCLADGEGRGNSLAQGQHAIVMRRFRRLVEENPEQPLYIPEISKAIRVSSRTLQACCQEHLRMGPKHYLLLRRMHLV